MSTPLLHELERLGHRGETWASAPLVELLEGIVPAFPRLPTGKISGFSPFLSAVREMRAAKFQAVLIVNRNVRSALVARLAGIPIRVGHNTERRGALLTQCVPYDDLGNEAESYLDLARALEIPVQTRRVQLCVSDVEQQRGRELLQGAVVGIQPGSTHGRKAPPAAALDGLIDHLADLGKNPVLLGGPGEEGYAERIRHHASAHKLIAKCRLRETLAVISQLETFVAGDTGLVHMAVGLGVPAVSAFAYEPASKWGHFEPPNVVMKYDAPNLDTMTADDLIAAYERCRAGG
jgi:heptosyltransferase II